MIGIAPIGASRRQHRLVAALSHQSRVDRNHHLPDPRKEASVMPDALNQTLTCSPASQPRSVDDAHVAMQDHLHCDTDTCGTRQEALYVLVRAGRVVLAPSR
jgi:hypothetical protein